MQDSERRQIAPGLESQLLKLVEQLQAELQQLKAMVEVRDCELASARAANEALRQQISTLQKMLFGRKSERLVDNGTMVFPEMKAFFEQQDAEKQEAEKQDEKKKNVSVPGYTREAPQKRTGWGEFPEELERVNIELKLGDDEIAQKGLQVLRTEEFERLAHRSEYVVYHYVKYIYSQGIDREYNVPAAPVSAPPPENVLSDESDRTRFDLSVPVHCIVEKFLNHMPFHRQSQDLARQGVTISRGTMCDWAGKMAGLLEPLYTALRDFIMAAEVLHADESPVNMLDKGKCRKCYVWVRKTGWGPPATIFHFAESRSQEVAKEMLGDFTGTFISDAFVGYSCLEAPRAGCWAHVRRKFFELKDGGEERLKAIGLIQAMYANERKAFESTDGKSSDNALAKARQSARRLSAHHVDDFFNLCREIEGRGLPPSAPLLKAAMYALNQKAELELFLKDPRLGIDNNPAERAIRPWAVGRKNWLFVGNKDGGRNAAMFYSFLETCRDNGFDFEKWLLKVLPMLAHARRDELKGLLPLKANTDNFK